ncbi:MAG: biotin--[acetyl-CoA-carboxylase] ligase [candidate division WOR-3 bacterium]
MSLKNLFEFDILDSTQDKAFELLKNYNEVVVIAQRMLKGRGRYGNKWISDIGGLYMSIGFKDKDIEFSKRLLIISSIAVLDILKDYEIEAKVKIPNDIYYQDKKLCGILIEIKDRDVVLGIGLNINQSHFPLEIKATSMFLIKNKNFNIKEIAQKIYNKLKILINADFKFVLENYNKQIKASLVEFEYNGNLIKGEILGISENFEIVLSSGKFDMFYIREVKEIL